MSQVPPEEDICLMDYLCNITLAGESFTEETRQLKMSLLRPKEMLRIRNMNVHRMHVIVKSAQVAKEIRE